MAFQFLIIICDYDNILIIKRYRKLIIRISQNASLVTISQVGLLEESTAVHVYTQRQVFHDVKEGKDGHTDPSYTISTTATPTVLAMAARHSYQVGFTRSS
jgi:hypothetical protein